MAMWGVHGRAVVGAAEGDSEAFGMKVGLHRGSVLSPLLFVVVMEKVSGELQAGLPLGLLYVDGLVLVAESGEGLHGGMVGWKSGWRRKV